MDTMVLGFPGRDLRARLERDVAALGTPPPPGPVVTDDDLEGLPAPVQRYLRFAGVVGRPRTTSFRAHLQCSFRLRPNQPWLPAEIWQYDRVDPIARLFWMRIDMAGGLLPMVGRDSYLDGRGRMLGKLLDRVVVADGAGEPFDIGELTTWLNDAVTMAPALLLSAGVSFTEVDDASFGVALTDAGRTVQARVHLDERGAPTTFESDDRFIDLPGGPVRRPWSTPLAGWQEVDGLRIPTGGSAVWHLPDGDFEYARLGFGDGAVELDPPTDKVGRRRPARSEVVDAVQGAAAIAAMLVTAPVVRGQYNRWGATDAEATAALPGDGLVPDPVLVTTRAITIAAPPEEVWPWLTQLGHGRGGLYSYDALENLVGLDLHSLDALLSAERHLAPGDTVRLGKPGSPCFRVVSMDAPRSLVLVAADPNTTEAVPTPVADGGTGATWQWQLTPVRGADGRTGTRLVTRQRNAHPPGQRVLWRLVEPVAFVMERRMLQGIRDRAEAS